MKMKNQISNLAKELFKRECITKTELENFLAEEKAFEKLYDYNIDRINKEEEIKLKKLAIYRNQIKLYKNIIVKLDKMSRNKKDIFLSNSIDQLLGQIDDISKNILNGFGNYLPTEVKNKIDNRR